MLGTHPLSLRLAKAPRNALVLLGLVLTGPAVAEAPLRFPEIDQIVVRKAARAMDLYVGGQLVYTIEGIQLGNAPAGHKHFKGDERTPEGRYTIDYGNPESGYFLSLHISYPNGQDLAYARAQGRSPGGLIFIHGQPNDWPTSRVLGDWTDGCIALSNAEMEALWRATPNGTVIDILP